MFEINTRGKKKSVNNGDYYRIMNNIFSDNKFFHLNYFSFFFFINGTTLLSSDTSAKNYCRQIVSNNYEKSVEENKN